MITINEEDRTLGLRVTKFSVSNPDTETRTTRHPTDRLASTQIGTEIHTQTDNSNKPNQVTPGTTDQITVNKLSITSMLDQRTVIRSTTETSHRATIYLHPTQFSSSTTRARCKKYPIRFLSFKLLKSLRSDEESNFKSFFNMNAFYFPTGENRKDGGLEIDFMLDSGATC